MEEILKSPISQLEGLSEWDIKQKLREKEKDFIRLINKEENVRNWQRELLSGLAQADVMIPGEIEPDKQVKGTV